MTMRNSAPMAKFSSKPTLGLFASNFDDPYHCRLLEGAVDAARKHEINLIAYNCGEVASLLGERGYRNVLFDLANGQTLDALVLCAASMMNYVGLSRLMDFCERYPVPKVSL